MYFTSFEKERCRMSTLYKGRGKMLIGYARVSTFDQNVDLQEDALKRAGCEKIFSDKVSGAKKERPGMNEAISHLRAGDTLVIWKLDRLGRSISHLIDIISRLDAMGVHFQSITDGIDTQTPAGRFFFHVMAALSQMERELIIERTKAGLKAAQERGNHDLSFKIFYIEATAMPVRIHLRLLHFQLRISGIS